MLGASSSQRSLKSVTYFVVTLSTLSFQHAISDSDSIVWCTVECQLYNVIIFSAFLHLCIINDNKRYLFHDLSVTWSPGDNLLFIFSKSFPFKLLELFCFVKYNFDQVSELLPGFYQLTSIYINIIYHSLSHSQKSVRSFRNSLQAV